MKFQDNDILENRNGTQVIVISANKNTKEYSYKYLNASDPQFQGIFCHSADDIEQYWTLVPRSQNIQIASMFDPGSLDEFQSRSRLHREKEKCIHDISEYVGFTQRYKYCKKCDEKFGS